MEQTYRDFFEGDDGGDGGDGGDDKTTLLTGKPPIAGDPPALPEGAFMQDAFHGALPEDIRANASLTKYKTLEALARGHLNQSKLVGKDPDNLLEIPGTDDTAGRRAVLSRLGLPASATEYKYTIPAGSESEFGSQEELNAGLVTEAHKLGMLPEHLQGLIDWIGTNAVKGRETKTTEAKALATANVGELQAKWGEAYDQKAAAANFTVSKYEGLEKVINDAGLGTNPILLELLSAHGALTGEDNTSGFGGRGGPAQGNFGDRLTPDQARAQGNDLLRQSQDHKNPAERKRLAEEAQKFFAIAAPGTAT